MKTGKSYIIWMPENGSGKSLQFRIGPGYLIALVIVLLICVLSIPLLQSHIMKLNRTILSLESKGVELKTEIASLEYLKQNLKRIEKKDRQLSEYFGMDERPGSVEELLGKGGMPDMSGTLDYEANAAPLSDETNLPSYLENLESKFKNFAKLLKRKDLILDYTPSILPLDKKGISLSSGFGWRINPFSKRKEFHAALDISGNKGMKIYAPANGIVLKAGRDKHLGNYIVLRHSDQIKTIFGHLSRILVKEGDEVTRGKKIGLMGNSGLSTSSHLHYMVVKNDRAVNPMEYILDASDDL